MAISQRISGEYFRAAKTGLLVQCIVLVAIALLEWPVAMLFVILAAITQWLGTLLLVLRRPAAPTRWDLLLCRFGIIPLLILGSALVLPIWFFRGELSLSQTWFGRSLAPEDDVLFGICLAAGAWVVLSQALDVVWARKRATEKKSSEAPEAVPASTPT